MGGESKRSSFTGMAEAKEDVPPEIPEETQYDEVFGEITEDGPNYRNVGSPIFRMPAVCPS